MNNYKTLTNEITNVIKSDGKGLTLWLDDVDVTRIVRMAIEAEGFNPGGEWVITRYKLLETVRG